MKPSLAMKRVRAIFCGAVFGLTSALAWAMPRDHVCMVEEADVDIALACMDILGPSWCCWIYGI
jgi:hypothetical protein